MKLILLSGGSGKRLWPLSNDSRSKQFLRLLPGPEGQLESMVQRVWRQIQAIGLEEHSYIVTGKSQAEMIHHQLEAKVPLIEEPARRDTYAAILLGASYLHTYTNCNIDETVVVMPVDPYVEEGFFHNIRSLESIINQVDCQLVLVGVTPTYPSEKYGYILTEGEDSELRRVVRFAEKPKEEVAEALIQQGALWNCGVFAGKLGFFIQQLKDRGYPVHYDQLVKEYEQIKKISFDYEVVEKCTDLRVLPYSGYWKDLGTWNTLTEEMGGAISGKGVCSTDCTNTHIVNELDIPIAVLGVSNVVVAASPDGILVTDKQQSPRIKEVLDRDGNRPMYEERYWGWYKILELTKTDEGRECIVRSICIQQDKNISYHYHREREEQWTVTSGKGILLLDGEVRELSSGDHIQIPPGTRHSIKAMTDLRIIETQIGSEIMEEDIVRLTLIWVDALAHVRAVRDRDVPTGLDAS